MPPASSSASMSSSCPDWRAGRLAEQLLEREPEILLDASREIECEAIEFLA